MTTMRAFLVTILLATLQGQNFEVISINPSTSKSDQGFLMRSPPAKSGPGLATGKNCSLSKLIIDALGLQPYEIEEADWVRSTRFDLSVKIPEGTSNEQFHQILHRILVDRFRLTYHRERKEVDGFGLSVTDTGIRMKEHIGAPIPSNTPLMTVLPKMDEDGFPILPPGGAPLSSMNMATGFIAQRSAGETLAELASMLSAQLGAPVTDFTGLRGRYDFTLRFKMEGFPAPLQNPQFAFTRAVQEQLGLEIRPKKVMIDLTVVDHIEKTATENQAFSKLCPQPSIVLLAMFSTRRLFLLWDANAFPVSRFL